jgi:hypothetical protein
MNGKYRWAIYVINSREQFFPIHSQSILINSFKNEYRNIVLTCLCTVNIVHSHSISFIHKKHCSLLLMVVFNEIYRLLPFTTALLWYYHSFFYYRDFWTE